MKIRNKDTGEIREISISDMSDYGLSSFQKGGNFYQQLKQQNKPITDRGNFSNIPYSKEQAEILKRVKEAEKKAELEKYKSAKLFHDNNPIKTLITGKKPVTAMKPTNRELAAGLGEGIENFYKIPGVGIVNDFVNPLQIASSGIIAPWAKAPLQAQQSNSLMPYAGAAVSTALSVPMLMGVKGLANASTERLFGKSIPVKLQAPNKGVIDFIDKEEVAPHTNGAYGYPKQVSGAGMDVYPNTPNKFLNQEYSSFGNMEKGIVNKVDDFKSEIDWGKWNKEIPSNKQLMQEYNAIEQQAKSNNTWMKNPNGSTFQGTTEQFVQQNSDSFKKAFGNSKLVNPDGSPTIQYHGSAKKFDTFDESKFQLGDSGYSGRGIYTTPNKNKANSYALSSKSIHKDGNYEPTVYELYGQANNPISSEELIKQNKDYDLFNFHRSKDWQGDVPLEKQMRDYDAAIRNQTRGVERVSPWNQADEIVFPTNKQLKSATGNNGMFDMTNPNIYKAVIPGLIGAGVLSQKKLGGKINDNNGYLTSNLHNFTNKKVINSNHITTQGMAFPIKANGVTLFPNTGDFIFPTNKVTEKPLFQSGGYKYKKNNLSKVNYNNLANTEYNEPNMPFIDPMPILNIGYQTAIDQFDMGKGINMANTFDDLIERPNIPNTLNSGLEFVKLGIPIVGDALVNTAQEAITNYTDPRIIRKANQFGLPGNASRGPIKKFQEGGKIMYASIADIANLKQKKVKFKYV